jgi:hypothetical protein
MSTYSARTSHRGTIDLPVRPRESYNLYLPYTPDSPQKEELAPSSSTIPPYSTTAPSRRTRFQGLVNAYDAAGWILGFKEKSSLVSRGCKVSRAFRQLSLTVCSHYFRGCSHWILPRTYHDDGSREGTHLACSRSVVSRKRIFSKVR